MILEEKANLIEIKRTRICYRLDRYTENQQKRKCSAQMDGAKAKQRGEKIHRRINAHINGAFHTIYRFKSERENRHTHTHTKKLFDKEMIEISDEWAMNEVREDEKNNRKKSLGCVRDST
jgi:hypothetical protein